MNIAIALTLSRIALTPVILLLMTVQAPWASYAAALVFVIASITDYFDGYYARKLGLVSTMGKFLDPLADKILVSSILIYFVYTQSLDPWMVILFITRDTVVGGIRSIAAAENVIIDAQSTGKWKAALQMIALPMIMIGPLHENFPNQKIGVGILWLSVILSLKSGYDYFKAYTHSKRAG